MALGLQLTYVADDIVCVRRPSYFACFYLLLLDAETILIDAGMDSQGKDVVRAMEFVGRPLTSISTMVLTHWHNDHAAGAAAIQAETGCEVLYHEGDAPFLRRETATSAVRNWTANLTPELGLLVLIKGLIGNATPTAVEPSRLVVDGDIIGGCLEVVETPGHTPGHLCFRYGSTLFAGDALAVAGGRLRYMSKRVTPDIPQALASMRRLVEDPIDLVLPGHRRPLEVTPEIFDEFRTQVGASDRWPTFG